MYKQPLTQSKPIDKKRTENEFEITTEQLDSIREQARQRAKETNHKWVQRGIYLVCTACEMEHAIHIGTDKLLVGFEDNKPIFKDRLTV